MPNPELNYEARVRQLMGPGFELSRADAERVARMYEMGKAPLRGAETGPSLGTRMYEAAQQLSITPPLDELGMATDRLMREYQAKLAELKKKYLSPITPAEVPGHYGRESWKRIYNEPGWYENR